MLAVLLLGPEVEEVEEEDKVEIAVMVPVVRQTQNGVR